MEIKVWMKVMLNIKQWIQYSVGVNRHMLELDWKVVTISLIENHKRYWTIYSIKENTWTYIESMFMPAEFYNKFITKENIWA